MDTRTGNPARLLRRLALGALLCAGMHHALARADDPTSPTPTPATDPAPAPEPENKQPKTPPADSPTPAGAEAQKDPEAPKAADSPAPAVPPAVVPATTEPAGQLETMLILKDGSRVVGRLVGMDDAKYTMLIAGIPTRFAKEDVMRVLEQPPLLVLYKQMRASIEDTDLDRRVMLAEWLRDRKRLDLALVEVEGVLKLDALHPGAKQLKKMLDLQIDLNKDAERRKASKEAAKETGKDGPSDATTESDNANEDAKDTERTRHFPILSEDQINLIRVYELDLNNPPRLLIPRELITNLISRYADSGLLPASPDQRDLLYQARPSQILDLVFRLKAHDLYPMVKVMEDPASMLAFKRDIHQGWLLNGCASVRCHGGESAGRLMLKHARTSDQATYYTNFLILDRFRLADGRPLINYDDPEKSPLIQMAMPRNLTTRPHPAVRNTAGIDQWKPAIRSVDDRRYKSTLEWIRSMYKPRPDYGLTYDPPLPKGYIVPQSGTPGAR